jgi:E3 ubiquitin-protein ligase UBR2
VEGVPQLQDERLPLMVWQSCGFTVHSIVVSAMESEKPLFGSLSSRQNDCLSTFIRFCGVVGSNFGEPKVIRSHSLKLLSSLLEMEADNPSILDIDIFSILVSLTYSLPSLFNGEGPAPLPSCNIQDLHILRLALLAHITQLLVSLPQFSSQPRDGFRSPPAKDCRALLDLLQVVKGDPAVLNLDPAAVWQDVMVASLGFLRSCALFYHYLSGVAAPLDLTQILPPDQEFVHLAKYLGLPPSPRLLLDSPFTLVLARKWMSHPAIKLGDTFSYVAAVPQLISLPQDYSELINSISSFTCPRSVGEESKIPSMCLVCGTVVCSQSYCCQAELPTVGGITPPVGSVSSVGACTAHSHYCGAGSGIFLRVRECKIVMFSGRTKGCFESPPYLDQYGETDEGLRRGNPLSLCADRYQRLHRLWLNHGVAEKVTHNTEATSGFVTTEWINL